MGLDYVKIPFKGTHMLNPITNKTYCGIDVLKEKAFELCSNSKKKCAVCVIEKNKQEASK